MMSEVDDEVDTIDAVSIDSDAIDAAADSSSTFPSASAGSSASITHSIAGIFEEEEEMERVVVLHQL